MNLPAAAAERRRNRRHVGRWLGVGFGLESESEYPEPLRERATYEERRSE